MGGDTQSSYVAQYNVVEFVTPSLTKTYRYSEASFGPNVPQDAPIIADAVIGIDAAGDGDSGDGTDKDGHDLALTHEHAFVLDAIVLHRLHAFEVDVFFTSQNDAPDLLPLCWAVKRAVILQARRTPPAGFRGV